MNNFHCYNMHINHVANTKYFCIITNCMYNYISTYVSYFNPHMLLLFNDYIFHNLFNILLNFIFIRRKYNDGIV